jgi:hypothetical protein
MKTTSRSSGINDRLDRSKRGTRSTLRPRVPCLERGRPRTLDWLRYLRKIASQQEGPDRMADWHRHHEEANLPSDLYFGCSLQGEWKLPRHCAISEDVHGGVE